MFDIFRSRIVQIGMVLVFAGFLIPFLVVLQVVGSNFALLFFAHGASVTGLFLGLIGAAEYVGVHRHH